MVYYSALHWAKKAEKSAEKCEQIQEDLRDSGLDLSDYAKKGEVVHNTGDETIAGEKTFTNKIISTTGAAAVEKTTNLDSTVAPSTYTEAIVVQNNDKNGVLNTSLRTGYTADGSVSALLYAGKKGVNKSIGVAVRNNGTAYTLAPTPGAQSSTTGTEMATTGWVNDPTKSTNVVHRSGDETIDGVKTFNNTVLSYNPLNAFNSLNKNITRGTAPTSKQEGFLTRTGDKYNTNLAGIYYMHTIENENSLSMLVYDPTKSSGYDQAFLRLGYGGSGAYTQTVKPANNGSQSSANIATVGWVNDPSASLNVVHRSGDESVSGTKTMLAQRFIFGATNLGSYKEIEVRAEDGSKRLGLLRFTNGTDGITRSVEISVVDNTNSNRGGVKVGINSNGDTYATAPRPKEDRNDNSIATTAWVRTLINNSSDVVESGENWVKFKKGLILQWGVGAKGATTSITLPKPFTTTSYSVICTSTSPNGFVYAPSVDTKTTTSFIIHCYAGASERDTMWFAIGF